MKRLIRQYTTTMDMPLKVLDYAQDPKGVDVTGAYHSPKAAFSRVEADLKVYEEDGRWYWEVSPNGMSEAAIAAAMFLIEVLKEDLAAGLMKG